MPENTDAGRLARIQQAWADTDDSAERFAATGMDSDRLRDIMTGERKPSGLDLTRIAEACRVSVDWLLYGTEPAPLTVRFCTVNEEQGPEEPEASATGCACPPGDNRYTLALDGGIIIVHTACGKQPGESWGDWIDLTTMPAIPVTAEWETECDGSLWHGDRRCDCGSTLRITPTVSEPAPVVPGGVKHYCGEEAPRILADAEGKEWHAEDCWCTLPPHGREVDHQCVPCTERTGMPSWKDPESLPEGVENSRCACGHLRSEHSPALFQACGKCECSRFFVAVPCVRSDAHPAHRHSGLRDGVAVHGKCPGV